MHLSLSPHPLLSVPFLAPSQLILLSKNRPTTVHHIHPPRSRPCPPATPPSAKAYTALETPDQRLFKPSGTTKSSASSLR
ncbi:hypothetical protein BU26DRAFT_513620 [Trematosphaeria pertusa]|uniref:Uncharacterized protein n=1 Tax=Trematosphaeria pertusa TaxID=390896 RepID=A0A6A6J3S4_9PLEO|nr:uncharacterized protein BU26DRAFT_513620 [Trematosphaeria pertusa]KAF2256862.1 hypothetical protein BU26DRAFT_513620 [Trematosphaeria pertusa]